MKFIETAKTFVKTKKGKITVGATATAVVAVGIGIAVLMQGDGYRTISCQEVTGTVTITGTKNNGQAYVGEHLYSGDDVQVAASSELVLLMDSDKYVYADENTHFDLEASGSKEDSRIKINLYAGSELNDLQSKLGPNDSYEVDTPNSTMSVRGTRFRMTVYDGAANVTYTLLEVDEGAVLVKLKTKDGKYNGVEKTFYAGESVLIRGDYDVSEFVLGDDGEAVRHLDYEKLPKGNVDRLIELLKLEKLISADDLAASADGSDSGDSSADGSDSDVTKTSGTSDDSAGGNGSDAGDDETDGNGSGSGAHTHVAGDWIITKQPTCTEAGKREKKCECGEVMQTESIPATGHQPGEWTLTKAASCTQSGNEEQHCAVCGLLLDTRLVPPTGHVSGGPEDTATADCIMNGFYEERCIYCGEYINGGTIPALGHRPGSEEVLSEGSCVSDRRVVVRCQVCGDTLSEDVTPAPGHDYQDTGNTDSYKDTTSPPPSGQQAGSYWLVYIREKTCSRCGDTQWVEYDRVYVH